MGDRKEGSRGCLALSQGADLDIEPSSVRSKTKGLAAGCLKLVIRNSQGLQAQRWTAWGQGQSSDIGQERDGQSKREAEFKLAQLGAYLCSQGRVTLVVCTPGGCKSGQGPWRGSTWFLLLRKVKGPCRASGHWRPGSHQGTGAS